MQAIPVACNLQVGAHYTQTTCSHSMRCPTTPTQGMHPPAPGWIPPMSPMPMWWRVCLRPLLCLHATHRERPSFVLQNVEVNDVSIALPVADCTSVFVRAGTAAEGAPQAQRHLLWRLWLRRGCCWLRRQLGSRLWHLWWWRLCPGCPYCLQRLAALPGVRA